MLICSWFQVKNPPERARQIWLKQCHTTAWEIEKTTSNDNSLNSAVSLQQGPMIEGKLFGVIRVPWGTRERTLKWVNAWRVVH
jgi:hypothetical protein